MLCGPLAVGHATGVDYRSIVLRVRALREAKGERLSLRGGTNINELQAAALDCGWRVRRVFLCRRVRLATLARRIRSGRWVFRQRDHFFGVASATELRRLAREHPRAMIVAGWLVTEVRKPFAAVLTVNAERSLKAASGPFTDRPDGVR